MQNLNPRDLDHDARESRPMSLNGWTRVRNFRLRNSHLFRTDSSLYYFIERHYDDLIQLRAVARLGRSARAPILINESLIVQYVLRCAEK